MTRLIASQIPPPVTDNVPVGPLRTIPNYVTAARTMIAVAAGTLALATGDRTLLATGYAAYVAGDVLDGWLARRLRQETRLGAVLDIVCDRACTAILCGAMVTHIPGSVPVVVVFLLTFLVLDMVLSLSFLRWPLLSPNHFHQVDRSVWRVNWSSPAKAANTGAVVGAVLLGLPEVALGAAPAVLAVKLWSARRVLILLEERC